MSDFYVTLPSHSSKNDFPNNQANHFKIRLPHPVRLEGSGWKVGLSSIALPDAEVTVPLLTAIKDDDDVSTVLFKSKWLRMELGASMGHTTGDANFDSVDLKQVFSNVNEIRFMKSMIAFFEQRPIYNNGGPKFGSQYVTGDGKTNYVKFKWEGDELVMDNKDIDRPVANPPAFHVNVELAKKWDGSDGEKTTSITNWVLTLCKNFSTNAFPSSPTPTMTFLTRLETPRSGLLSTDFYNSAFFAIGVS